jgi:alpha-L-fucosidase
MNNMYTRTEWFREARFGMFVHWGLYAIPARGEWVMSEERISVDEYEKYFDEFNPEDYNPKEWARLAKEAGMQYVVLTAKHHDGFCLFDSKLTEYKSTNTKVKKDLVKDYVEAIRAEGLKVGLYYSLMDWHHPDYPKYNDLNHPMRGNEKFKEEIINFDNYLDYMHGQVKELVTNYGKIDILWFDYSYEDMRGEKWRATELIEMVRSYQPEVIIDNRLETSGEGFGSIIEEQPKFYCGDFASPEQIIPTRGITNVRGESIPWELCLTMNNHWCYCPHDYEYKPASLLIRKLVECVSKNGNMILNVGPDAKGVINEESCKILKTIGHWMDKNKDSIYGCGDLGLEKPEWGRYTKNGEKLYAHIFETPIGPLALTGIDGSKIKSMRRLADGTEVKRGESWTTMAYENIAFASLGTIPFFTYLIPDEADTVIEITMKE